MDKPKLGRKPLPPEEQLVSHGFHLRRHKIRLLQGIAATTGEAQREVVERLLEAEASRLRKNSQGAALDRAMAAAGS